MCLVRKRNRKIFKFFYRNFMNSMAFDEKECLSSIDPLQYKKDMAIKWARKRLNELTESEKRDFYKDLMDDSD